MAVGVSPSLPFPLERIHLNQVNQVSPERWRLMGLPTMRDERTGRHWTASRTFRQTPLLIPVLRRVRSMAHDFGYTVTTRRWIDIFSSSSFLL